MNEVQQEFSLERPKPKVSGAAKVLAELLREASRRGNGWMTASEILVEIGRPVNEGNRRWLRDLANESQGEIASGQLGYKLVREMTGEEYNHFRNWMKKQADEMTGRILRSDKVFYGRQAVKEGNGIL
jgi:hypothetical protein